MKVKVKRLFRDEADFVRELKRIITEAGVYVRRNQHWHTWEKGVFIDLAVPGPDHLDPILFAIECKAYTGQQALQNAIGKCMIAHRIAPGRVSVCLCLPSDDRTWQHSGLFDLRDLCDAYQIALLNEKTVVEHIQRTKLTDAFNSLPKPPVRKEREWAGAEMWKRIIQSQPPVQRPMEVWVTDHKQVRKSVRDKERALRREANKEWGEKWRRVAETLQASPERTSEPD